MTTSGTRARWLICAALLFVGASAIAAMNSQPFLAALWAAVAGFLAGSECYRLYGSRSLFRGRSV